MSKPLPSKTKCHTCGWKGMWREILKAPHPWDEDDVLVGCPQCREVNTVYEACGVDGCYEPFYMTNFPKGPGSGRTFCYKHKEN